jgi:pimeloyl-ACP methyl ester carboxylesterase
MRPTIVLVHGAFAESASWDGVVDRLQAESCHVVAAANPLRGLASDAQSVSDLVRTIEGPVTHALPVSRPDATVHPILEAAAMRVAA